MGRRDYYHPLRNFRSDGQASVAGVRTFIQWTVRKWSDGTPDTYDNPIGARYILSHPADKLVRAGSTYLALDHDAVSEHSKAEALRIKWSFGRQRIF